eukprot:gene16352-22552_t
MIKKPGRVASVPIVGVGQNLTMARAKLACASCSGSGAISNISGVRYGLARAKLMLGAVWGAEWSLCLTVATAERAEQVSDGIWAAPSCAPLRPHFLSQAKPSPAYDCGTKALRASTAINLSSILSDFVTQFLNRCQNCATIILTAASLEAGAPIELTKFTPTVPGRRKKGEDGGGGSSLVKLDSGVNDDAFKDLIKAAASEAKWQRGQGRGRGGPGGRGQQAFEVTFGGVNESGVKKDGDADMGPVGPVGFEEESRAGMVYKKKGPSCFLDYNQFYPSSLPLRPPEADMEDDIDGVDLVKAALPVENLGAGDEGLGSTAEELNFMNLDDDNPPLFLVQMPTVLPVRGASQAAEPSGRRSAAQAEGGLDGGKPNGGRPVASTIKELPSGRIGKLLVFKSGKMKLQLGGVLMDVSVGTESSQRQDVAAINSQAGHCVLLGEVGQRLVVSPDVMQLMDDTEIPDYPRDLGADFTITPKPEPVASPRYVAPVAQESKPAVASAMDVDQPGIKQDSLAVPSALVPIKKEPEAATEPVAKPVSIAPKQEKTRQSFVDIQSG